MASAKNDVDVANPAGERLFIDYAGHAVGVADDNTGAELFNQPYITQLLKKNRSVLL